MLRRDRESLGLSLLRKTRFGHLFWGQRAVAALLCQPGTTLSTWILFPWDGSSSALSQESSRGSSGSSGSSAKADGETPQPRLEELPAAAMGTATNVPWFGEAQLLPKGLKYPKNPSHARERRW